MRPSPKNVNPFLVSEVKEDPTLELALQALAAETSKRTSRMSNIVQSFLLHVTNWYESTEREFFYLFHVHVITDYMCVHFCPVL